ncbi:NHL domain-containing protein [Actinidia rufa]|uniref:NHL domain-containing protein n=1 Tax=Actinidia rufa TaxID=165716 RepID=A0A7J0G9U7_9ERIC|nr:NHL domain-containing protein [Actinidia rufa]
MGGPHTQPIPMLHLMMRAMGRSLICLTFSTLLLTCALQFQAHAAHADGNVLQFEKGYLVDTVVEGKELGVWPYQIRVSGDGELFAVDSVNSNIVRITPPLSQYSRARLVAGSFQGYTGHVDGKPSDALFNHPKGVTVDDKGNVYVADTSNLAIRKIGEGRYILLQLISKYCFVCDNENFVNASIEGYASCMLQQGFGSSLSKVVILLLCSFTSRVVVDVSLFPIKGDWGEVRQVQTEPQAQMSKEKPTPIVETVKDEQEAAWPSFGRLAIDLSKLAVEALGSVFFYFIPFGFSKGSKGGLTPLKDSLVMPKDEAKPPQVQKQRTPTPLSETRQAHTPHAGEKYSEMKPPKMRSTSFKDPSLLSKHRSSKRQEYAEFYGSGEAPLYGQHRSKSQKDRTKHRQREKSEEVGFVGGGVEQKPVEMKPVNYDDPKFDHYNMRSKFGDSFRFE